MIIDKESLDEAYNSILHEALSQVCTVLVFVSPETDSLCSLKILTHLLQTDSIQYLVKPVSGYEDIARANEELIKGSDQFKSIIMLNCGGIVDLREFLSLTDEMSVYVIDSHRPYHLSNVRQDNEQIRILEASDQEQEEYPSDVEDLEESEKSAGEGSDEEMADEEGGSEKQEARQRRKQQRIKIMDYYRYSYYGRAASGVLYDLAIQVNKDNNDLLWMSIVGLTDQLVFERIQKERYEWHVRHTSEEVDRLNFQEEDEDTKESKIEADQLVSLGKIGHISFKMEYRFICFRHWNLYDSMYHSQYVATRLGVWMDSGQRKLHSLLAKMGIPLSECKAKWPFMQESLKDLLSNTVEKCGTLFGLNEIKYGSFAKQHTRNIKICASDMVYSVTALLEDPSHDEEASEKTWERNFWFAYDSLSSKNIKLFTRGIEMAIETQKAIVRQASAIIQKKTVQSSGPFRYVVLEDSPDQKFFSHTLSLSKLALFMVDAHQQKRRGARETSKPFVICASLQDKKTYLLVGVTGAGSRSSQGAAKNSFGNAFHEATNKCKARVKHDGFETSVIEVQRDDLKNFLEILYSGLVAI
eukprot:g56480.t1